MVDRWKKLGLPVLAILVLVVMVAAMSGVFSERMEPSHASKQDVAPENLFTVGMQTVPLIEPIPASVEAREATSISARLLARINQIHVRSGDLVEAGQLLVELERSDLLAIAQQVRERIKAIQARLNEAELNLGRIQKLRAEGVVPAAELDKAKAGRDALAAELDGAGQALQEAETAVTFSEIRSPIAGRIVDRLAEPGDTASPGTILLSLYNPLSMRVEARVRETLALTLGLGQKVDVEIPAQQKSYTAVIEEIVPAAEAGSRSFLMKVRLNEAENLLPGMYARLLVPAGTQQQLLIPASTVRQAGQLTLVWVWQDEQLQRRFVRIGETSEADMLQVIAGLQDGDKILLNPDL